MPDKRSLPRMRAASPLLLMLLAFLVAISLKVPILEAQIASDSAGSSSAILASYSSLHRESGLGWIADLAGDSPSEA